MEPADILRVSFSLILLSFFIVNTVHHNILLQKMHIFQRMSKIDRPVTRYTQFVCFNEDSLYKSGTTQRTSHDLWTLLLNHFVYGFVLRRQNWPAYTKLSGCLRLNKWYWLLQSEEIILNQSILYPSFNQNVSWVFNYYLIILPKQLSLW